MFGYGPGFGGFFGVLSRIAEVLGTLILAAVLVGVTVLLVRFLLVGTRAAQLYVDRHEPPKPSAEPRSYAPEPSAPTPASPVAASPVATAPTSAKAEETPAPKPASSHASTATTAVMPEAKPAGRTAPKAPAKSRTPKSPPAS